MTRGVGEDYKRISMSMSQKTRVWHSQTVELLLIIILRLFSSTVAKAESLDSMCTMYLHIDSPLGDLHLNSGPLSLNRVSQALVR